jgi:DNA-binding transcriptional ArsR family regulator
MTSTNHQKSSGWVVGQSIMMELDFAITYTCGGIIAEVLSDEISELARSIPDDWRDELSGMLGKRHGLTSILESAALLAGVLEGVDYGPATLAMRELSIQAALERLARNTAAAGLLPDSSLPPLERLVDLQARFRLATFAELGLHFDPQSPQAQQNRRDVECGARILQGGDLHERFWHWLDRFYYELYRHWRSRRQAVLDAQESHAAAVLGAREKPGTAPDLAWLPQVNPLLRYPELNAAVAAGRVGVFFWVEPFGLADSWLLRPGQVLVSFAEPGKIYENFYNFANDVATRAQALADPTRLVILRLIRNIGMTNTDMAAFLGLARPTVSVHARILREAGLIRSYAQGRITRHEIIPAEVHRLFRDLEQLLDLPPEEILGAADALRAPTTPKSLP